MFTLIGAIVIGIITVGSCLALFGVFGPLTENILAIVPLALLIALILGVLLFLYHIAKVILTSKIPNKRKKN